MRTAPGSGMSRIDCNVSRGAAAVAPADAVGESWKRTRVADAVADALAVALADALAEE